jgi:hypothetical protein
MTTAKSKSKKVRSMQPPQKRAASRRQGRTDPDRLRRAAEGVGRQVYRCQAGPGGPMVAQGRRQGGVQDPETNSPKAAGLAKNLPLR